MNRLPLQLLAKKSIIAHLINWGVDEIEVVAVFGSRLEDNWVADHCRLSTDVSQIWTSGN